MASCHALRNTRACKNNAFDYRRPDIWAKGIVVDWPKT